jgi:hypothetical protein
MAAPRQHTTLNGQRAHRHHQSARLQRRRFHGFERVRTAAGDPALPEQVAAALTG